VPAPTTSAVARNRSSSLSPETEDPAMAEAVPERADSKLGVAILLQRGLAPSYGVGSLFLYIPSTCYQKSVISNRRLFTLEVSK